MSELEMIIQKYLSKEGTAITFSDFDQQEVNKLFHYMGIYERPDILSIYDNKIVAIEHFEFDSYKNTSKGSDFKIQKSFIERKMQNKINSELKTKDEVVVHDEIKNSSNVHQYYDNFKKVFYLILIIYQNTENTLNNTLEMKKILNFGFLLKMYLHLEIII